jgi:hypothetical protein
MGCSLSISINRQSNIPQYALEYLEENLWKSDLEDRSHQEFTTHATRSLSSSCRRISTTSLASSYRSISTSDYAVVMQSMVRLSPPMRNNPVSPLPLCTGAICQEDDLALRHLSFDADGIPLLGFIVERDYFECPFRLHEGDGPNRPDSVL